MHNFSSRIGSQTIQNLCISISDYKYVLQKKLFVSNEKISKIHVMSPAVF